MRILTSFLVLMFTAVATGSWDCGCAYADPLAAEMTGPRKVAEAADCHSAEKPSDNAEKDTCCSGCRLENKSLTNSNFHITPSVENKGFVPKTFSLQNVYDNLSPFSLEAFESEISASALTHSRSVPFYNTSIYLAVQSLLI